MKEFLTLFKYEMKTQFPLFSNKGKVDLVGRILTILVSAVIIAVFVALIFNIAETYVTVKVNKVSAPIERAKELINVCYLIIVVVTALGCMAKMRTSFSQQKSKSLFLRLPVKQQTLFMSKLCALMVWNYGVNFFLIVPINVIFYLVINPPFTFWISTFASWLLMPMISFFLATLLVIPFIKLMDFISNKHTLIFVLLSALLITAFLLYARLLSLVQFLLETGSVKHIFNENFVNSLQGLLSFAYPVNCFANLVVGQNVLASIAITIVAVSVFTVFMYLISKHLFYATLYKNENPISWEKTKNSKQLSPLASLLKKEFISVFRNTNQLFSYFAIATAMPFMVYSCYTLFQSLIENALGLDLQFPLALLTLLVFSILTNTFCATNVSRDGLSALKSKVFPVKASTLLIAKILFCAIVSSLSVIVSASLLFAVAKVSLTNALFVGFIGLIFSTAQIFIATRIDLNNCEVSSTAVELEKASNRTVTKVVFIGLLLAITLGVVALIIPILSNSNNSLFIMNPVFAYVIPLVGSILYLAVAFLFYNFNIEKSFESFVM